MVSKGHWGIEEVNQVTGEGNTGAKGGVTRVGVPYGPRKGGSSDAKVRGQWGPGGLFGGPGGTQQVLEGT